MLRAPAELHTSSLDVSIGGQERPGGFNAVILPVMKGRSASLAVRGFICMEKTTSMAIQNFFVADIIFGYFGMLG